jgi:O-antigen/teichoic acid export membrane protein
MSRVKYFSRSLVASYGALGATVVFTLLSIPLALAHLPPEEFGLWGLIVQVVHFLQLAEMGITGACARILIEHKDERTRLNGMVKITGMLFVGVGICIFTAGFLLAPWISGMLAVPETLRPVFVQMLRLYALVVALGYVMRPFHVVLFAFQRNDLTGLGIAIGFAVQLAVLWVSLRWGLGLWSLLIAFGASVVWQSLFWLVAAGSLGLVSPAVFAAPFRSDWCLDVLAFARDRALVIVGLQVLSALPVILISRFLGLQAVAAWVVGTRLFMLSRDALYRLHDMAYPALAEMFTRGELERFRSRFESLTVLTLTFTGVCAAMIATLNTTFIGLWTSGQIQWSRTLDFALAGWLVLAVSLHSHWVAISISKDIGLMRLVYFGEALLTGMVAGIMLNRFDSLVWMPLSIILGGVALSLPYTARRIGTLLGRHPLEVAIGWLRPGLTVMVPSLLAGIVLGVLTSPLAPWIGFTLTGTVLLVIGLVLATLQAAIRDPLREALARWRVIA